MPRLKGSGRQKKWLRAFAKGEFGPPIDQWPAPRALQRWLENDAFRSEWDKLRRAGIERGALQAILCAQYAWKRLTALFAARDAGALDEANDHEIKYLLDMIRRAERWLAREAPGGASSAPQNAPPGRSNGAETAPNLTIDEAIVRSVHPNCRPEVAIAFFKGQPHPDRAAHEAEEARREAEEALLESSAGAQQVL